MAALDFPASPTNGQTYTGPGGVVWSWDTAKWINGASAATIPLASTAPPLMDGTATAGTSALYAREGHVHPTDTTRAPINAPGFTGAVLVTAAGASLRVGTGSQIPANDATLVACNPSIALAVQNNANVAGSTSMYVRNDRTDGYAILFMFGATNVGGIVQNGTTTSYNTTSDYRLKTVYGPADALAGAMIDAVPVYDAEWNAAEELRAMGDVEHCRRYPMFLAHELQAACPWAVTGAKDAVREDGEIIPQQVNHGGLVAVLWAEVQSLRARVAALEPKET